MCSNLQVNVYLTSAVKFNSSGAISQWHQHVKPVFSTSMLGHTVVG